MKSDLILRLDAGSRMYQVSRKELDLGANLSEKIDGSRIFWVGSNSISNSLAEDPPTVC